MISVIKHAIPKPPMRDNPQAVMARMNTSVTMVQSILTEEARAFSVPSFCYEGCGTSSYERKKTATRHCVYLTANNSTRLQIRTFITDDMRLRRHLQGGYGAVCVSDLAILPRSHAPLTICADAQKILSEPNAGGTSVVSETLSMEYMHQRFCAADVLTEMQIKYWSDNWKKVDFICSIATTSASVAGAGMMQRVGVSVTRAMGFPDYTSFTFEDGLKLLHKKLNGLVVARAGVDELHRYDRSVLHIWCQHASVAATMRRAFDAMLAEGDEALVHEDVCVVLTVAEDIPEVFIDDVSIFGDMA